MSAVCSTRFDTLQRVSICLIKTATKSFLQNGLAPEFCVQNPLASKFYLQKGLAPTLCLQNGLATKV